MTRLGAAPERRGPDCRHVIRGFDGYVGGLSYTVADLVETDALAFPS
jgi:hypothetical protein